MPAMDSHSVGADGVGSGFTISGFSTDTTNEVVFVLTVAQSGSGGGADGGHAQVSSVTDNAGLTWTKRSGVLNADSDVDTELWWAPSPAVLAADSINVFLSRTSRCAFLVFAVTGLADINNPIDNDPSCPSPTGYPNNSVASPPISTQQARCLVMLPCGVYGDETSPTVSSPFAVNFHHNGTYVSAWIATDSRLTQALNLQAVVAGGIEDLNILADACKGPGWLRFDTFVGGC